MPDISEEAAEAVQQAVIEAMIEHGPDGHIDGYEEITRAALESAAPHLMAQAWDEGMEAMYATTSSEWPPIPEANPYRPAEADRG